MTLQTTGRISLSDIATEFGQTADGTQPISLSEYRIGGSAGVTASTANANIPTTLDKIMMSDFYGAEAGVAPLTAADITLVGGRTYAVSSISGATSTVTLTLNNDGSMSVTHTADVAPTTLPGAAEWLRRTNDAADTTKAARVEVRVTLASGSATGLSGPPMSTWLGLNNSRSWTLSGSATRSAGLNFEFRESSTSATLGGAISVILRVN